MTWLPLYSMGATHQNMKASLRRVNDGERLSWSRNSSVRKTMVSTSQYLEGVMRQAVASFDPELPEYGHTVAGAGAHRVGVLESMVSWKDQAQ